MRPPIPSRIMWWSQTHQRRCHSVWLPKTHSRIGRLGAQQKTPDDTARGSPGLFGRKAPTAIQLKSTCQSSVSRNWNLSRTCPIKASFISLFQAGRRNRSTITRAAAAALAWVFTAPDWACPVVRPQPPAVDTCCPPEQPVAGMRDRPVPLAAESAMICTPSRRPWFCVHG